MKFRPVTCIHVTAYLFSALVLGASALSQYRLLAWQWTSEYWNSVYLVEGFLVRVQQPQIVYVGHVTPSEIYSGPSQLVREIDEFSKVYPMHRRCQILGILKLTSFQADGTTLSSLTALPLWYLLLPSMAWLCGFYLFKLLRRFRAVPSDSPTPQSALDVPSGR